MMLQAVQDTFLGVLRPSRERFDENLPLQIASLAFLKEEGPKFQRSVVVEEQQLDGDACQEAMSLLNYATDTMQIFRKMRETFQHRQKLINDSDKTIDILSIFPRFLDTKGLVNQDFILLFNDEVSNRLLQKWDPIFRCNVIKEAKQLTSTPELRQLLHSAESPQGSDEAMTYDAEMASLLLLLYLLPPPPGGPKFPKISASDAVEKVIVFHKSCCSLEEHLQNQQNHQPYLLAVGREKRASSVFEECELCSEVHQHRCDEECEDAFVH
ncbi:uncharacterized protein LOC111946973 isoform X2 [Oryzias latipes]